MGDTETRFAHLLEPIRDLAQNWSINIANELEEYLSELESVTIQFEDSRTLNFAEAALLIQGSACIYCKKVEHLYALVYQTLNEVVEKKRVAKENSIYTGGMDADVALKSEAEEAFLTVENMLKEVEAKTIMLISSGSESGRTPCLVARNNAPDYRICRVDRTDFKMHSCHVHVSGALLLSNVPLPDRLLAAIGRIETLAASLLNHHFHHAEASSALDKDNGKSDTIDHDSWDGSGAPYEVSTLETEEDEDAVSTALSAASSAPYQSEVICVPAVRTLPFDPWAPLDAHEPSRALRRPFRKGKTYSAPDPSVLAFAVIPAEFVSESHQGADDAESCVNNKENEDAAGKQVPAEKCERHPLQQLHVLLMSSADGFIVPLKQPLWAQFATLHAAEARRRAGVRKHQRFHASKCEHVHLSGTGADAIEMEATALTDAMSNELDLYGDEDETPTSFSNDDDDCDTFDAALTFGGALVTSAGCSSYEELCREHVESALQASTHYTEDMELFRRINEWTNRVEPLLLEESTREHFDIQTYRARMLANFERSEQPKGQKRRKRVADDNKVINFLELAQSREQYEVCRMFLTALQLVNTGIIEIVEEGNEEVLATSKPHSYSDHHCQNSCLAEQHIPLLCQVVSSESLKLKLLYVDSAWPAFETFYG